MVEVVTMPKKQKPLSTDDYIMLFCAFRYALGRQTYVVGVVADRLIKAYPRLTQDQRDMFVRDINDAYKQHGLGAVCDEREWLNVRNLYDENRRVIVNAYFPLHSGIDEIKQGQSKPPVEINKAKKPVRLKAIAMGNGQYLNDKLVPLYYAEVIGGTSWT